MQARLEGAQMRRMTVLILLCAVVLSGCSDMPKTWRKSEIEEIAADKAEDFADAGTADVSDELSTRINELEQRIDDLERENRGQRAMIDELYENQRKMADYVNRMNGL